MADKARNTTHTELFRLRVTPEQREEISEMRKEYKINISELLRNCLEEKYQEVKEEKELVPA